MRGGGGQGVTPPPKCARKCANFRNLKANVQILDRKTPKWFTLFRLLGVHTIRRQLTPSPHTTGSTEPFWCLPLWPYVGQVLSWGYIKVHQLGLHQGAQPWQEGFPQTLRPKCPLRLTFRCGDLSGIYSTRINIQMFVWVRGQVSLSTRPATGPLFTSVSWLLGVSSMTDTKITAITDDAKTSFHRSTCYFYFSAEKGWGVYLNMGIYSRVYDFNFSPWWSKIWIFVFLYVFYQ